jgi:hypothetical protein
MNLLSQYGKEIFAIVLPVFTLVLNKFFKNGAKVCYGQLHQFTYLLDVPLLDQQGDVLLPTQTVHTQSYVFRNEGREPATKMEVVFNYPPQYLNIWPARHYEVKNDPDRRQIMIFDYLAPKEVIRCEVMSFNSGLPVILSVRCKEGIAQNITLSHQKVANPATINFVRILIFLGSVSLVYLVIVLLQWLLLKTG